MALTCLIGPSLSWDAVAYIRGMIEDLGPTFVIPDATLKLYIEAAAEEYSKWEPLGEFIVGNIGAATPTSPLNTVANISRYAASVANGFLYPVAEITDVSFAASGILNAADVISYERLIPASTFAVFASEGYIPQKPSSRIIRAEMLNEVAHYSQGLWSVSLDATGQKVIDIFPVPGSSGSPIFVRYTSAHINVPDGQNNPTYPTIPENHKRYFGKFALAEVLDQEADRLSRSSQLKAGVMQRWSDSKSIKARAAELRSEIETALGSAVTVGIVSR